MIDKIEIIVIKAEGVERQKALEFQNIAFSEENPGKSEYELTERTLETDPYLRDAEIFIAKKDDEIIGTTNLYKTNKKLAKEHNTIFGLPIEKFYDLENIKNIDTNLVQAGGAVVLPKYRNSKLIMRIWREMYRSARFSKPESEHMVILAASELTEKDKANLAFKTIYESNLYDNDREIKIRSPKYLDLEPFDKTNRKNLKDNELISKQVQIYIKMNLKFIGYPVYYERYGMYDFPMLWNMDELNPLAKKLFLD